MRRFVLTAAAAAFLVACDSSTDPIITPIEWEAELEGAEGYAEAGGSVTIDASPTSFVAEIELTGVPEGEYDWEVAAGTCEEPGNRVGTAASYTQLEADDEGEATAKVTVTGTILSTGTYHASVFFMEGEGDDEERVAVACGDLERS